MSIQAKFENAVSVFGRGVGGGGEDFKQLLSDYLNPVFSRLSQGSLSSHDFNHLLGRVCSISDPTVKLQTFELTFDNIQLGCWTRDEWNKFAHKLLDLHPKANQILENKV